MVLAKLEQGCAPSVQHVSLENTNGVRLPCASDANASHDYPTKVELLSVRSGVRSIPRLAHLVNSENVATKKEQYFCFRVSRWYAVGNGH